MRLTTKQIAVIKQKTALIFGDDAHVYLFGSRIDESTKGGDIDLFVELTKRIENPVAKTMQLNGALQLELGMQKIDIIFHAPNDDWKPIHTEAKKQGVIL